MSKTCSRSIIIRLHIGEDLWEHIHRIVSKLNGSHSFISIFTYIHKKCLHHNISVSLSQDDFGQFRSISTDE